MTVRILFSVFIVTICLGASTAPAGQTWQWVDDEGVTHIFDTPPPAKYQEKPKPEKTETERRAAAGDTDAQFFLKYHKAATKGDVEAQYKLGLMYLKGRGVQKDHEEAVSWLTLAAAQGHVKAKEELSRIKREQAAGPFKYEAWQAEEELKRPKLKTGAVLCQIKPGSRIGWPWTRRETRTASTHM